MRVEHDVADAHQWFVPRESTRLYGPRTVYIAGPMRGIPDFNFPAFNRVADRLRAEGYSVANPAETSADIVPERFWSWSDLVVQHWVLHAFLKQDFACVLIADVVMVLDGWLGSEGARAELFVAQMTGTPIVDEDFNEIKTNFKVK